MNKALVFIAVTALNLVLVSAAFGRQAEPACPNFQGSYLSPNRMYGVDVTQVDIYQAECRELTWTHYAGMNITNPVTAKTDGVWREGPFQKSMSELLQDKFVTVTNYHLKEAISVRTTWTKVHEHILVVSEMVNGEITDPVAVIPHDRMLSSQTTIYARVK